MQQHEHTQTCVDAHATAAKHTQTSGNAQQQPSTQTPGNAHATAAKHTQTPGNAHATAAKHPPGAACLSHTGVVSRSPQRGSRPTQWQAGPLPHQGA